MQRNVVCVSLLLPGTSGNLVRPLNKAVEYTDSISTEG